MAICPKCGSDDVVHSRSSTFQRLAQYCIFHKPYRCQDCWHRFWFFRNPLQSLASKVVFGIILFLVLLIVFCNYAQHNYRQTPLKRVQRPSKKPVVVQINRQELIPRQENKASSSQETPPETLKAPKRPEKTELPKEITKGFPQADEASYRLKDIEVQSALKELRVLILIEGPEIKYDSFFLSMPPRLVVDLKGKWGKPPKKTIAINDDIAKSIRIGRHAEQLRVVLDLRVEESPSIVFKASPQGLIIILRI